MPQPKSCTSTSCEQNSSHTMTESWGCCLGTDKVLLLNYYKSKISSDRISSFLHWNTQNQKIPFFIYKTKIKKLSYIIYKMFTFYWFFFFPGHCTIFQNKITTFNGVEFKYSMPANCYHVLVQDCSPELKFLVMVKRLEESADLTAINVRLASQ